MPQGTGKTGSSSPSRRPAGGSEAEGGGGALADKGSPANKTNKQRNRAKPAPSNLSKQLEGQVPAAVKDDGRKVSKPARAVSTGQAGADNTATPTKSKRRGGQRNKHQSSPTANSQLEPDVTSSSETEQPPAPDSAALLALIANMTKTKSAQSSGHPRRDLSSGDEWDMPTLAQVSAKENLSWQQELLAKGSAEPSARRSNQADGSRRTASGPPSRPTSARPGQGGGRQQGAKSHRPVLHGSVSDSSGAGLGAGASGLTWQQEMLQHIGGGQPATAPSFGALEDTITGTPDRRNNGSNHNRRHQQRDAETFGLGGLSVDDPFGPLTPSRHHNQARPVHHPSPRVQSSHHQHQHQHHQASVTPTKPTEPRYAGPTFHNSPAPSSLPMPSFMLRRQAAVGAQ